MYETYFDALQLYFGQQNLPRYIDTDAFVLSIVSKDSFKDLQNLNESFDSSNLKEDHELFSNKSKQVVGKFKIETPENVFIDEFICLGSQASSLKCGIDDANKLKSISESQSKTNKIEKYYNCFFGGEYKKMSYLYNGIL